MGWSAEELADRAGCTAGDVERFAEAGILSPRTGTGTGPGRPYEELDIARVRLAQTLVGSGVDLGEVGAAVTSGTLNFDFIDQLAAASPPMDDVTLQDLADEMQIAPEMIRSLYAMWALPRPGVSDRLRVDDVVALRAIMAVPPESLDQGAFVASAQAFGEALRKIVGASIGYYHAQVGVPMHEAGVPARVILNTAAEVGSAMADMLRTQVGWGLARFLEESVFEYLIADIERAIEESGAGVRRPEPPTTIAFLDLSGFTALTERAGDAAAAELAATFAKLVQASASEHGGRSIKLLGDGAMFAFPDAPGAVACGLDLVARAPDAGLPHARMGIHTGEVIERGGDYFGRTVNIASRILDSARPEEVLVSESTRDAVRADDALEITAVGPFDLRGLSEPMPLFTVARR